MTGIDHRTLAEKDYDDMWLPGWGDAIQVWSSKTGKWTRYERRREKVGDDPLVIERGKKAKR